MTKRSYSIAFKKEVLGYISHGNSPYNAAQHFSARDNFKYDSSMFYQWVKKKDQIHLGKAAQNRCDGGGRKPKLDSLEQIIADEIIDLRIQNIKVTRYFISDRAIQLASENNIELLATGRWIDGFMSRNNFSLRRMTNMTTLTESQLLQRAVDYLKYLRNRLHHINLSKTVLMDETSVYFEDATTQTVDLRGRRHVVMKSTGFSSMRITVALSVWGDGRKAAPLVIHKGKANEVIYRQSGPILWTTQDKAWVNQNLIISWIDTIFPLFDVSTGKCIVWDSCRAHVSQKVKDHCRKRNIELIVIPGGMTPYVQAGDIGIFKLFKIKISSIINTWKNCDGVEYTKGGNPKPPKNEVVRRWVLDSWNQISNENISNSILSAGFHDDFRDWHISKHDVYGRQFRDLWENTADVKFHEEDFESIIQEDEITILNE